MINWNNKKDTMGKQQLQKFYSIAEKILTYEI